MGTPRIVIAGAHSGAGKTSVALALVAALRRRGLRVQTFKVGPDYLDPTYLARASDRPCFNLDGFMMRHDYVCRLYKEASRDADLSVIEGAMGLFDGVAPTESTASTAEIATWLSAPTVLVVDAHGASRSFAAMVEGFVRFEPGVSIAGIVANRVGSTSHGELLARALKARGLPPLLAAIPRGAFPGLPSRHLGLQPADDETLPTATLVALADALEGVANVSGVMAIAEAAPPLDFADTSCASTSMNGPSAPGKGVLCSGLRVRLGVAQDEAFQFYYPENLRAIEERGCDVVPFSPLRNDHLPEGLDGLYFGGGYPEVHAEALAANHTMKASIQRFAETGRLVYAECGGLMYLAQGIQTLDGTRHVLVGILPCWTRMLDKRKALGYVEVELTSDSFLGARGTTLRGHEFHYSEIVADFPWVSPWEIAYRARRPSTGTVYGEGFLHRNVLASYIHLHFAGEPSAADCFVGALRCPPPRN